MMRNKFLFIPMLVLSVCVANGQNNKPVVKFHSLYSIALLQGQSGPAFQWQTINGVQYASWFAGVGAGVDYYNYRGVPLFIDLRKEFGSDLHKFFVYGDLGFHFNWLSASEKENNNFYYGGDFHKGIYTDAGIGYSLHAGKAGSLLFSIGHTYKTVNQSRMDYTPVAYDGPPAVSNNRYSMGRVVFRLGWKF